MRVTRVRKIVVTRWVNGWLVAWRATERWLDERAQEASDVSRRANYSCSRAAL